jgi:hypothetical protein
MQKDIKKVLQYKEEKSREVLECNGTKKSLKI